MRILPIVISALFIAVPSGAHARPKLKIAVAPLVDDAGNKVAQAVADAVTGKDFTVTGPKEVQREMTKLGLSEELDAKGARKLAKKLGVAAVIGGQVSKAGRKRSLHLEVHRRGQPDAGFTVEFKSTTSAAFRRGVHDQIKKKLEGAAEDPADDDDEAARPFARTDDDRRRKADDEAAERKRKTDDDEADRRRKADDDERKRKAEDEAAERKRKADDGEAVARRPRKSTGDDSRKRRVASADDEDDGAVRKRKGRRSEDAAAPLVAARVGAGASVAQRQLAFDTRAGFTQVPPRVLTTAGAARVDGEIYPLAIADPGSSLAGLGLAAAYDKTLGLAIKVPNQAVSAPINQAHYSIGVRYRLGIGEASSVAFGLDYARRQYIADRSGLMAAVLDAPDVDYTAIAPGAALRVPVTPSIAVFGAADGLLMLQTGAIQKSASYGPATVYGLEGAGGVDIAITRQIGVRVALEVSQIMFAFNPKGATLANNRDNDPTTQDVSGATDRSIGVAATLGLTY